MNDLLENAPCGVLVFEDGGRIVTANKMLANLLEYAPAELTELKFDSLLTTSSRIFHQTHFHPMLRLHGRADEIYLMLRAQSGKSVPVLTNAVRREELSRWLVTCVMMPVHRREEYEQELVNARNRAEEALRNNEELRRTQLQLEQHLRELDQNLSEVARRTAELVRLNQILSHDLREPVRKLRVFADLLKQQERRDLSDDELVAVNGICSSSLRIHNLLRALQAYISVDNSLEERRRARLTDIARAALRRVRGEEVQLEVLADELPEVSGFPRQLVTFFECLYRNAWLRRGEEPLVIKVRSTVIQLNRFRQVQGQYHYVDHVRLTISDNTRGFQGLDPDGLFELLSKSGADHELQTNLAICRKVIENHHGSIALTADTPTGATFTVFLPVDGNTEGTTESKPFNQ